MGLAITLAVQANLPTSVAVVYAYENVLEDDDLNDGHGVSHRSTVDYSRQLEPWAALVRFVKYEGRHPDSGICWHLGTWRHQKTEYKRWTGSSWALVDVVGTGDWLDTGTPGLDDYTIQDDVTLWTGALVSCIHSSSHYT